MDKSFIRKLSAYTLVIALLFYSLNRCLKPLYGNSLAEIILKNHFNDFLGGIVFLSYVNIMISFSKYALATEIPSVLFYASLCSFAWEFIAPQISEKSTGDWLDVLAYFSGAFLYLIVVKLSAIYHNSKKEFENE